MPVGVVYVNCKPERCHKCGPASVDAYNNPRASFLYDDRHSLFSRTAEWTCINCGHVHIQENAPAPITSRRKRGGYHTRTGV